MAFGPQAALPLLDALRNEPALRGYHLLPAARADMLERAGERETAFACWHEAATLAPTSREREWLLKKVRALGRP
jgi:RNA polymerase sigma-70 factor (ECF subfamily)